MKIASYVVSLGFIIFCGARTTQAALAQADWQAGMGGAPSEAGVEQEAGPVNILFVLDASYSMKEKLGGEMKMNAAKEVLQNALSRIPNNVNLGLRVFGQSYAGSPEIDCRQTALLVPIGQHNRVAIIKNIQQIQPFGMTPIMFSLRLAAEQDFRGIQGSKTIILITDGADTCGGDPCAYVQALRMRGIRMKVDVVGLGLAREKQAREQLNCISTISLGKYYAADSSQQLIDSIGKSVDKAISGRVLPRIETPKTPPDNGTPQNTEPLKTPVDTPKNIEAPQAPADPSAPPKNMESP